MSVKLIAIDIDGTLINSNAELTRPTIDALQKAADRGIHIAISTGRQLSEFQYLMDQLPMIRYAITGTGTQVIDVQTGTDIFRRPLTNEQLQYLYGLIRPLDAMPQIFSDADGKVHNRASDIACASRFCGDALVDTVRNTHVAEEDLDAFVANYTGITNKIHMFFGNKEHKKQLREQLKGQPYEVMESYLDDLEIMPQGVSKGLGLEKLAEHLGLDRMETMAFGDGGNDVEMLSYAGYGIAMQNASDSAKAAADYINPRTNDEDGVAYAIGILLCSTSY